jgi:hypothetical protein
MESAVVPSFLHGLMRRSRADYGVMFFCLGILVYGAFGVPTPNDPGTNEKIICALFFISALCLGVWRIFIVTRDEPLWFGIGRWFLIFGLSLPLAIGLSASHEKSAILRDLIAFAFLMMPVIFISLRGYSKPVLWATLGLGILFSVRSVPAFNPGFLGGSDKLDYLENMPSLLMAALFFGGTGIAIFCERFSVRGLVLSAGFVVLSSICLMPMIVTAQRASVGVFIFGMLIVMSLYLWRVPKRAVWIVALCACIAVIYAVQIENVFETLLIKSMLVGANMRFEELSAVWGQIAQNPVSLIFGMGWGAHYPSPAVAGISVNYTHSLLSALMLKTGLSGLLLGAFYLAAILASFSQFARRNVVFLGAIAGPILIDVFLYASYKSLDFGLVLGLAAWLGLKGLSERERLHISPQ